jgi:hypothetical protein
MRLAVSQNRALSLELRSYKRKLVDARRELDLMRSKSREMETLVGVIQRNWSQLDIDASMLLDVLGDAEKLSLTHTNSELLTQLMKAGQDHQQLDPTDETSIPRLGGVDQWSSPDEIERAKVTAIKSIEKEASRAPADSDGSSTAGNRNYPDLAHVDEGIAGHAQFTLNLLERICVGISESGIFENVPQIVTALSDQRSWQSERLLLTDRIAKLSAECVCLEAKLHLSERQTMKFEREMNKRIMELESSGTGDGMDDNNVENVGDHSSRRSRLSAEVTDIGAKGRSLDAAVVVIVL